ncbi:ATP-dependent 3'-5' DNA helicase [Coemansia thaxteri]|nr:ATP-dependent 3'-5' DNA helicase [Coemansia thaxteri]
MASLVDSFRRRFRAFATASVFITAKNNSDQPTRVKTLTDSVPLLTADDVAGFSGVLGPRVLKLFWDTPAAVDPESMDSERCLYFLLQPTATGQAPRKHRQLQTPQQQKRRSISKASSLTVGLAPVITALIHTFDSRLDQLLLPEARDGASAVLAELARKHMPADPTAHAEASVAGVVESLQQQAFYHGQIVAAGSRVEPAAAAQYAQAVPALSPLAWDALRDARGIAQLFTHQAQAIAWIQQGHDVVASTGTASGKSVIYQLPITDLLIRDPEARVVCLYPTKALAQDQLRALRELLARVPQLAGVRVAVVDGDTPLSAHEEALPAVVLTNPDALHAAMLPHPRWRGFWPRLRLVVVDELHVYQAALGQHVRLVLARLQRLARSPAVQFVACSATTSNPREHLQRLTGRAHVRAAGADGSPRGPRHLLLWDGRAGDTARISAHLLQYPQMRCVVFCQTRRACELVVREIRDRGSPDLQSRVLSYRGGYSAEERRAIEAALFAGRTRLVVATSALELGIDVGAIDAVVVHGVPRSPANLWQQIGRAGRRSQPALAVVVAQASAPLDRHAVANPQAVFTRCFAPASIAADPAVAAAHLQCAAFEMPVDHVADAAFVEACGLAGRPLADVLAWDAATQRWVCPMAMKPWPAAKVPLRSPHSAREDPWLVILSTGSARSSKVLEEMEPARAVFTLYEGGVFLHQGLTYSIELVDPESRTALVVSADVSWHTTQLYHTNVLPAAAHGSYVLSSGVRVVYGSAEVAAVGTGYRLIDSRSGKAIDTVSRPSPRISTISRGLWIDLPASLTAALAQSGCSVDASIHAAQHALLLAATHCVRDCTLATMSIDCKSGRSVHPRLMMYELPHASAASDADTVKRVATKMHDITSEAERRVSACTCASAGCIDCVYWSPGCREQNRCIDRSGALMILRWLATTELAEGT